MMREKYHQDWLDKDIPRIQRIIQNTKDIANKEAFFQQLLDETENAINQLKKSPYHASKKLRYGQLAEQEYYACKFFSSPSLRFTKQAVPDMRIIFKYSENYECIYLKAVGFRHEPPSIYEESEVRGNQFE